MASIEPALHAVRTLAQFELAEAAAKVAQAATLSSRAQHRVTLLTQRCESVVSELRGAIARSRINPALLDAMRRLYQAEHRMLQDAQVELAVALRREQQLRDALAELRNRERALERAVKAERRKRQAKQQTFAVTLADDMWLQHAWRVLS